MSPFFSKTIRAIQLDPQLYLEVAQDKKALSTSLSIAFLSNISAGIGASTGYPGKIPMNIITAFLGWFIWCALVYLMGIKSFPAPGDKIKFWSILCFSGFAIAPGLLRFFAYLPPFSAIAFLGATIWTFGAMSVAIEKIFQKRLLHAVGINLIGWVIYEWFLW
ncbi:MAG: hypothetical protein ACE5FY_03975 [Nitrospiria bacterium]